MPNKFYLFTILHMELTLHKITKNKHSIKVISCPLQNRKHIHKMANINITFCFHPNRKKGSGFRLIWQRATFTKYIPHTVWGYKTSSQNRKPYPYMHGDTNKCDTRTHAHYAKKDICLCIISWYTLLSVPYVGIVITILQRIWYECFVYTCR